MKKTLTLVFTLAACMLILDTFNAGHALAAFILAGVIPGTNITISATAMMMLYAVIAGFILARLASATRAQNHVA
ncbi:hypothetical protein KI440_01245 [Candidatus Saccharibacteria bacterium TM7i]|nr:hypothetical protein KI440_01245 [Candidatus Saccharibacteria bacterium TM7i]